MPRITLNSSVVIGVIISIKGMYIVVSIGRIITLFNHSVIDLLDIIYLCFVVVFANALEELCIVIESRSSLWVGINCSI